MGLDELWAVLELRRPTAEAVQTCSQYLLDEDAASNDVSEIFEKLREWLRREGEATQKLIQNTKIQASLVLALRKHSKALEVARHGCGVVAGCVHRSNLNCTAMLKAGVVKEILHVMDIHQDDSITQDNACVALWRLAERTVTDEIVQLGGLERLFRAMRDHLGNPFVQVNGICALQKLYQRGGAPSDGISEANERAMAAHPNNTQLKRAVVKMRDVLKEPPTFIPQKKREMKQVAHEYQQIEMAAPVKTVIDNSSLGLKDWLLDLDDVGFLLCYLGELKQNFDSLAQVVDVYAAEGKFDPQFFEDFGVRKLGHRRLFEQWFRENL